MATTSLLVVFGALVLARVAVWLAYRKHIALAATRAHAVMAGADRWLQVAGTLLPLALVAAVGTGVVSGAPAVLCAALAGLAAAIAGAALKYALVTRAAFNQGFALRHLPVRGTRS
jgi:phenylacetyl-CoA:acceptor oxidoreductase subunit 2